MKKRLLLIPSAVMVLGLGVVAVAIADDKPAAPTTPPTSAPTTPPTSAPATTAPTTQASAKIANTKCPVSGDTVDPKVKTVAYEGKTIGFCCEDCVEPFKKNPEKYSKNIK